MTESTPRNVKSLHELAQDIAPKRDLWPQIEAQLAAPGSRPSLAVPGSRARRPVPVQLPWLAAAAAVGCVALGVWIGRSALPGAAQPQVAAVTPSGGGAVPAWNDPGNALDAAYVNDPRYARQRAALLRSLQARLSAMPQPSRDKVTASLAAIEKAKQDLEQALGKDPGNALLQELLVNTYQDEMRALTDVREASDPGRGI